MLMWEGWETQGFSLIRTGCAYVLRPANGGGLSVSNVSKTCFAMEPSPLTFLTMLIPKFRFSSAGTDMFMHFSSSFAVFFKHNSYSKHTVWGGMMDEWMDEP